MTTWERLFPLALVLVLVALALAVRFCGPMETWDVW